MFNEKCISDILLSVSSARKQSHARNYNDVVESFDSPQMDRLRFIEFIDKCQIARRSHHIRREMLRGPRKTTLLRRRRKDKNEKPQTKMSKAVGARSGLLERVQIESFWTRDIIMEITRFQESLRTAKERPR